MQEDGAFDFEHGPKHLDEINRADYIRIENNGSDVTIFSFAGAAVLFAGMPQFEFRKLLTENHRGYNLVFVRDPSRSAYTKAPDGSNRGLEFFKGLIEDALDELGSSYNIAVGASAGGAGAFFVSSQLNFQQIITFSPGFPQDVYINPKAVRNAYLSLRKLFTEPKAYFEVLFVTIGAQVVWRTVCRTIGEENVPDVTRKYLDAKPRPPRATIFYGQRCAPDTDQAMRHKHIPSVHLRPVDSGRHNCAGDLKKQGILGKVIMDEIDAGLAEWRAGQASHQLAFAQAEG